MIKNYLEQDLQQAMVQSLTASQRREEAEEEEQRKEKAIKGSWVVG